MNEPCLCGDYMCPSCGPAQGYDPKFEALCEKLAERLPALVEGLGIKDGPSLDDLLETIATRISTMLAAHDTDYERTYGDLAND